jgi:uncharacterized membrane protein
MVLVAFTMAPVSLVAPMREISVLIGAWLGVSLLGEGQRVRRLIAAAVDGGGRGAAQQGLSAGGTGCAG